MQMFCVANVSRA